MGVRGSIIKGANEESCTHPPSCHDLGLVDGLCFAHKLYCTLVAVPSPSMFSRDPFPPSE
jgi:hypothetical protein